MLAAFLLVFSFVCMYHRIQQKQQPYSRLFPCSELPFCWCLGTHETQFERLQANSVDDSIELENLGVVRAYVASIARSIPGTDSYRNDVHDIDDDSSSSSDIGSDDDSGLGELADKHIRRSSIMSAQSFYTSDESLVGNGSHRGKVKFISPDSGRGVVQM